MTRMYHSKRVPSCIRQNWISRCMLYGDVSHRYAQSRHIHSLTACITKTREIARSQIRQFAIPSMPYGLLDKAERLPVLNNFHARTRLPSLSYGETICTGLPALRASSIVISVPGDFPSQKATTLSASSTIRWLRFAPAERP